MNQTWQAKWIWIDAPERTPNVYAEARTVFPVDAQVRTASLRISANQEYKVYVNGVEIGNGPSPSDVAWKYYDEYDVADRLTIGDNCLAIVAYNFGTTDIVTMQRQGPGGMIAQLDVRTDESDMTVGTDESWRCRRSPRWVNNVSRMHNWGGYKEIYLAEKEDGWELAGYDDSSWERAKVVADALQSDSPWPRLLPREIPFLRREVVQPRSIVRIEENYGSLLGTERMIANGGELGDAAVGRMILDASVPGSLPGVVFDFSAVKVGYPELLVHAPEGGVLQLFYGESLELTLLDTFVLKRGENRLSPYGRRAFRYLKLSAQATPAPIAIDSFQASFVRYPFKREGEFECSDPLLNRIWDIGRYTTEVNSQDHLEDCPYREQALWVVDAVVMAKVIYQTFGDTALVRKCLLQGARIQNDDGSIPGTGPERNEFLLPDFNAYWFLGVYDYWKYSGDDAFVKEVWEPIRRLIAWFREQEDENGLFARADRDNWWCFVDWADYIDKRDRVTAVSCLHHKVLRKAAVLAAAFGDAAFAAELTERADRVRDSIRSLLWIPEKRMFADCLTDDGLSDSVTFQTNFIAVWSGIMTDEEAEFFLTEGFLRGACPELKGAFFYHIVLEVLYERGYVDAALDIIRSYWGEMVARGATTWWETFDPSSPRCTVPSPYQGNTPTYLVDHIPVSHCHGWGASPTYVLSERTLGVDVREISSGAFEFRPALGDLAWAKGTVPTAFGPIRAEWRLTVDGTAEATLEYPERLRLRSPTLTRAAEETKNGVVVVRGKLAGGETGANRKTGEESIA
ncbi:alpha-L-rhamnosidase [Paenibacillus antri]|uniref:Alpha-L-rhamnosidase n=1 Tax=Paenibacillus antri TaxID=2582848 RepID=A0A5R9GDD1_9BACL|nr:alpha-L-rhamnosidase N-terminal domain-containing protein [Paenibacillus antri]TLS52346.1 alpha-L-rhamnosidase [Paenibacillus antri]